MIDGDYLHFIEMLTADQSHFLRLGDLFALRGVDPYACKIFKKTLKIFFADVKFFHIDAEEIPVRHAGIIDDALKLGQGII